MSEQDDETAVWPGFPYVLVDTQLCPACFHNLTATTCRNCGLDLADPRSAGLLDLGRRMLSLEGERQKLIDEIRVAHPPAEESRPQAWWEAEPPAATLTAVPEPAAAAEADFSPVAVSVEADAAVAASIAVAAATETEPEILTDWTPVQVSELPATVAESAPAVPPVIATSPPPTPPPAAAPAIVARPPRRRLTVPVLLLIVGVTLVGVAAVFFLVLAWNIADTGTRALIIGGITLATLIAASVLRRFSLTATAEAVGALGVILLGLDAWAVRANDLFGAADVDAVVYAGVATLAVGVVYRLWSVVSRLRGPDLAATLALPAGLGLLVAGLLPLETSAAAVAGLLGTAVGGLAHALPAPWSAARPRPDTVPERTALAVIGVAALVSAAAAALFFGLESMTVQLAAAGAVILLGVVYLLVLRPWNETKSLPGAAGLAATAGAVAAAFAASFGWQMVLHDFSPVYVDFVAPVIAIAVPVAFDRWLPRVRVLRAARIAATGVGAASLLVLLGFTGPNAAYTISGSWTLWETPVFAAPAGGVQDAAVFAAITSVIVAVLLFLAPTLVRPRLRDVRPVAASVIVIAGASGTGIPIVIVGTAIVVAAIALVALARGARPAGWGGAAAAGALMAFLGGFASPWLWAVGVAVAVAVAIVARVVGRPNATARVLLAVAPVVVCAIAALIAPSAIAAAIGVEVDPRAALVFMQWVALGALVAAVTLRLDAASRAAVAFSSYGLMVISFMALLAAPGSEGSVSAAIGEPALSIVRTAAFLVLLALIVLLRTRLGPLAALCAAVLIAPVAAWLGAGVIETVGTTDDGWTALTAVGIAAAVVWLGALVPVRAYRARGASGAIGSPDAGTEVAVDRQQSRADAIRSNFPAWARRAADIGALATTVLVAQAVPSDVLWVLFVLVAIGFAGASVTRGWAGLATEPMSGVPQTRADGAPLARAPRRLFAWLVLGAATAALWLWLDSLVSYSFEIEAFVLPPAIGLLAFAVLLIWLRRQVEATMAVALGFAFGLVVPAIAGTSGSPVRGTVVAIISAAVVLALAWTPARRVRIPALTGAITAIVALTIVAAARALDDPTAPAWLLLLVGAAYASAYGFRRGFPPREALPPVTAMSPSARAEQLFAVLVPPITLAIASLTTFRSLDSPLVATAAFVILGGLHLAAAGLDRVPLGMATRWTALAGAILTATGAWLLGDIRAIEVVSMPIALMLLGGSVLAMWRRARTEREWPGTERIVWLGGLAVAIAPSVVAPANDVRTWLVIVTALLAAIECVVVPVPDSIGLKTPSAMLLTLGALAMGTRALLDPAVESGEFAALTAGAAALLIAAAMVWQSESDSPPRHTTWLAAAGTALAVLAVAVHADGDLARTTLTAIVAGIIGVGGAVLLRWKRWAQVGAVLAVGGVIAALLAVGTRFAHTATAADAGVEPDLWAFAGVGIVVAIGITALRSTASRVVTIAVSATFSIALTLFTLAELVLIGASDPDELRTVLTMSALTTVGVVAAIWRERLGIPLAVTGAVLTGVFGIAALAAFAVDPIELVTVPPAVGLIVLGTHALLQRPQLRTWPALGPGLVLLTLPSLVYDFTIPSLHDEFAVVPEDDFSSTTLWRVVTLGVVAVAMVVVGAVWRLQAPLVLGSAVLIVHALSQLWPWISSTYEVPWWLWLGVGGAVLIFLAARYERRMRQFRAAFVAVASLR